MHKYLLALSFIVALAACKRSVNEPEIIEPISEVELLDFNPVLNSNLPQGDPTYNFLGYGYDITGKFQDPRSTRAAVVNMEAFSKDKNISPSNTTSFGFDSYDGEDANDLVSRLFLREDQLTESKMYTETFKSFFPDSHPFESKFVYGLYINSSMMKLLRFRPGDISSQYLTDAFKADVSNKSAQELVEKYGTHIIASAVLGAKLTVFYQAETKASDRKGAQHAGYNFALKKMIGLYTGNGNPIDSALLRTIKNPKLAYEAIGGDPSKITIVTTTNGPRLAINDWMQSITPDNAVLISPGRLTPLYTVIDDPLKKAEIQNYISTYLTKNEVKVSN